MRLRIIAALVAAFLIPFFAGQFALASPIQWTPSMGGTATITSW